MTVVFSTTIALLQYRCVKFLQVNLISDNFQTAEGRIKTPSKVVELTGHQTVKTAMESRTNVGCGQSALSTTSITSLFRLMASSIRSYLSLRGVGFTLNIGVLLFDFFPALHFFGL